MATKDLTGVRPILLACTIVLLIVTTGCQPNATTPTAVPRPPISAADVKTLSAEFDRVSKAYIQAWNSHDVKNMRPLLTDDILYYEEGNHPTANGAVDLLGLNWMVLHDAPNVEGQQAGLFISRESAFDIWQMWNYNEAVGPQSKEDPIFGYDWYMLRDGKIADMWLFWSPKHLKAAFNITYYEKPLQDYEKAWSSGNPQEVAGLYAPDAVRHDALFGGDQRGPSAVQAFASSFFSWYPGVRLERLQSFQLGHSVPVKTGGVYAIHARDQAGKPCDVRAIVLLESPIMDDLSAGKIINEWLFYQADSLIACGWAQ